MKWMVFVSSSLLLFILYGAKIASANEPDSLSQGNTESSVEVTPTTVQSVEHSLVRDISWRQSIFFDGQKVRAALDAMHQWMNKSASGAQGPNGLTGSETANIGNVPLHDITPLFVHSILYVDSGNWVVWVNQQRISSIKPRWNHIQILAVNPSYVRFKMDISQLSQHRERWAGQLELTGVNQWRVRSGEPIWIYDNPGRIEVELGVNQYFVGNELWIAEGKILTNQSPPSASSTDAPHDSSAVSDQPLDAKAVPDSVDSSVSTKH
jgi:hypothetical protein